MKMVFISSAQVPSDTANSIQVMKVCQAFTQLGHECFLLVPGPQPAGLDQAVLQRHYGLRDLFKMEWLRVRSRRFFPWEAVRRAQRLGADILYVWPLQSAALGLLVGIPSMLELHDFPSGIFGPLWLHLFLALPGRKRLLPITRALRDALHLPADLTIVAPDGVDLERYTSLQIQDRPAQRLGCLHLSPCFAAAISTPAVGWTCSWHWRKNSPASVSSGWAGALQT
jgi:hypothetical protein